MEKLQKLKRNLTKKYEKDTSTIYQYKINILSGGNTVEQGLDIIK